MANLTASGTAPDLLWQDTDSPSVDWRMRADADQMTLQADVSGWTDEFRWAADEVTSYRNLRIKAADPALVLYATPSADYSYRLRSSGGVFKGEVDDRSSPQTWSSFLESAGVALFAPGGLGLGHGAAFVSPDYAPDQAICWRLVSGTLPVTSPQASSYEVDLSAGVDGTIADQVLGAIVMLTDDTAGDKTYLVFDFRVADANGYNVQLSRSASGDTLTIHYDTGTFTPGDATFVGIAFYEPGS